MCVRGGLQSKLYTSQQWRRQGGTFPPNPENLQGWETASASASSEPREQQKIQIFVNLKKNFFYFLKPSNFS